MMKQSSTFSTNFLNNFQPPTMLQSMGFPQEPPKLSYDISQQNFPDTRWKNSSSDFGPISPIQGQMKQININNNNNSMFGLNSCDFGSKLKLTDHQSSNESVNVIVDDDNNIINTSTSPHLKDIVDNTFKMKLSGILGEKSSVEKFLKDNQKIETRKELLFLARTLYRDFEI
jgi:hypothetical protein